VRADACRFEARVLSYQKFRNGHNRDVCYPAKRSTTFASICDDADCVNYVRLNLNNQHLLCPFLTPEREHQYTQSLRQRSNNLQLPDRTPVLKDKNFIIENIVHGGYLR